MKEYVDSLIPESSKVWSVDEMAINVKKTKWRGFGFYDWMWSVIDPQTKFVIASEVSKRREISDAATIFANGKKNARSEPLYVITDALRSYEKAFRQEFDIRKTAHVKTKSLSEGFANRPIERYHNEFRSVIKSKRGLGNDKSAQEFADAYRVYHNFVRPHSGLPENITPAEASGIDLNLGKNKIKDLIVKSKTPYNFATQLGKRLEKVNIVNEKDCIRVIPKGWIEKQTWREINDILRLSGFSWLSNDKDSCWIKMMDVVK
jgi:transposase-like protein